MEPIVIDFEVRASPEHAFSTWTERAELWWPKSHCMSQSADFGVVFEPFVGGRIYETGPDGVEYEWGEVSVWDPPTRVVYFWHIFLKRDQATMVSISFTATDEGTSIRLENFGFEVFGDAAPERVERVGSAWQAIVVTYRDVL